VHYKVINHILIEEKISRN